MAGYSGHTYSPGYPGTLAPLPEMASPDPCYPRPGPERVLLERREDRGEEVPVCPCLSHGGGKLGSRAGRLGHGHQNGTARGLSSSAHTSRSPPLPAVSARCSSIRRHSASRSARSPACLRAVSHLTRSVSSRTGQRENSAFAEYSSHAYGFPSNSLSGRSM